MDRRDWSIGSQHRIDRTDGFNWVYRMDWTYRCDWSHRTDGSYGLDRMDRNTRNGYEYRSYRMDRS